MIVGAVVMALKGENDEQQPVTVVSQSDLPEAPTIAPIKILENKVANKVKKATDPFETIKQKFGQVTPTAINDVSKTTTSNQPAATNDKPVVADNRCIVAIDGVKYDVTVFRKDHSGGDIFTCNTDMSAIFHSEHPNSFLQKMTRYKI